jgi:AraC family transcriptional regulator
MKKMNAMFPKDSLNPEFVTRPAFTVAGMPYRGKNEYGEIARMWVVFMPRSAEIPARRHPDQAYGVIYGFDNSTGVMDYLAGVEVTESRDLPDGMISLEIPAQTYAVFECTLPTLMQTMGQIYGEWLPASGYGRADGPEFEFYDERYNPQSSEPVMAVYVPVEKKK